MRQAQRLAHSAHLILEQLSQMLDQFKLQIFGQTAYIVVRLDVLGRLGTALQNVGINRTLTQERNIIQLARLFFKHADEFRTDDLALLLRIGDALRLLEEALFGGNANEVDSELALEDLLDLLGFIQAHAAMINEHAREVLADRLVQKNCTDR